MKRSHIKPNTLSIACCAVAVSALLTSCAPAAPFEHAIYAEAAAVAQYPEMSPYPDESSCVGAGGVFDSDAFDKMYEPWSEQRNDRYKAGEALDTSALDRFSRLASPVLLNSENNENKVYSPVNVYMALSLLAEITGGETRSQILRLAGAEDIEQLRTNAANLWYACYRSDGATVSILANSLWLDTDAEFNADTINTLADKYFASVYRGDLSSEETLKDIKAWLNDQTEGLLESSVDNLTIPPDTIMTLCSTICFHAKWDHEFNKDRNDIRTFHGAAGDTEAEFMNQTFDYGPYYWGEDFGAISLHFKDSGSMWLILPDQGKTVEDLLSSGEFLDMIGAGYEWENRKSIKVNCSVPKFDVSSDIDLAAGLKRLGVTDVFDGGKADFSPLSEDMEGGYISKADHAARVMIDEEGCTAVAFTAMMMAGAAIPPDDEIDFVLDRPFLFVIMSDTEQVLFMGEVNRVG